MLIARPGRASVSRPVPHRKIHDSSVVTQPANVGYAGPGAPYPIRRL